MQVLPERMPDCSYFLRGVISLLLYHFVFTFLLQTLSCSHRCSAFLAGLCSNTTCPYRHVKVNENAPVCEDFLKGYCADGDEVFMIFARNILKLFNFFVPLPLP
jgi:hypothetical protein